MAFQRLKKLTSWSYSRYTTYISCPLKAKLSYIDKLGPTEKPPAMERGNVIHKLAEDYLKGNITRLPKELKSFEAEFKRLRAKRKKDEKSVLVEESWTFTDRYQPTAWNDWNNAWLRVKMDIGERTGDVVEITDVKTGKYRPDNIADYLDQQEIYALGALIIYGPLIPNIQVRARLMYVDYGVEYPKKGSEQDRVWTMADLEGLKKAWEKRVKPLLNDQTFAPRPHKWCYSCHFRKDNVAESMTGGGRCKF